MDWTDIEDDTLKICFKRGLSDDSISIELVALGYKRSSSSVNSRRRRMNLFRHDGPGSPTGRRSKARPAMPPEAEKSYWAMQRTGDNKFHDAMRLAGYQEFTDTRPCTENARVVRAEPEVRSAGGVVFPPGGPR